jgi:hypothetical protein
MSVIWRNKSAIIKQVRSTTIMTDQDNGKKKTVTEELEIAGGQLVEKVKELVKQGNARRLIIRTNTGRVLLDTPLTVGAGLGGALALVGGLPLAAVAAIAAAFARVRVEIIREVGDGDVVEVKKQVEIKVEETEES